MSDLTIKVCDVCDRHKGESNHWFSFYYNITDLSYLTCPVDKVLSVQGHLDVTLWKKADICSVDCLNKAENRTREGEKLR